MRPPLRFATTALAFGPLLAPVAIGASLLSAGIGAAGTIAGGRNAAALGQYQQGEYNQQAQTAVATGQRNAQDQQYQNRLVQSTLQARAAGSGASATSASTLGLSADIAKRGEYKSLMDLSQGQNQAAGLENIGQAARYGGTIAQQGDAYAAAGTIAGGIGSAFGNAARINNPYSGYGFGYGPQVPTNPLSNQSGFAP